jgi:predicted MPP superfamily phosphohydrolase
MIWDAFWLVGVLVGHGCLGVVATNMIHGCGIRGQWPNKITLAFFAFLGLTGLWLAWSTANGGAATRPTWLLAYERLCVAVALVGLPLVTLSRSLRKVAPGLSRRTQEIDLRTQHGADRLIGSGWRAALLRPSWCDSLRLQCHEWEMGLPGWPPALDGLSITHLTDLHMAPCYRREFFEIVLGEAARWDADLVVLTGDLIESDKALPWVAPLLSMLRGRLGTFAILGNHDIMYDHETLRRELATADVIDVDGRWEDRQVNGTRLAIGGTSAPWGPRLDMARAANADARIVLSHTPDLFPRLAGQGANLVLSGHNHGGQVRLPVIGPVLVPSLYSRRYDQGPFRRGDSILYVGRGVGASDPIRYRCPIEITRLVLRSTDRRMSRELDEACEATAR